MFSVFALCDDKGKFIYEIMPELFGPILTIEELEYWSIYRLMSEAQMHGIEYIGLTFDELQDDIKKSRLRRAERMKDAESAIKSASRKSKTP